MGYFFGLFVIVPPVALLAFSVASEAGADSRPKLMLEMTDNGISSRKLDLIVMVLVEPVVNFRLSVYVSRIYEPLCQTLAASWVSKTTV